MHGADFDHIRYVSFLFVFLLQMKFVLLLDYSSDRSEKDEIEPITKSTRNVLSCIAWVISANEKERIRGICRNSSSVAASGDTNIYSELYEMAI